MTLTLEHTDLAPSNVNPRLLRHFLKCLTFDATKVLLFVPRNRWCSEWPLFEGLQRSGASKVYTIGMKRVGLWKRERPAGEVVVLWLQSSAHELCVTRQTSQNYPFAPRICLKSQQKHFWTIFTTLLSSVMQAKHLFFFFYLIFFFFHTDITHLYKPVLKISINCSLWG